MSSEISDKAMRVALSYVLSKFPEDKTVEEILDLFHQKSDEVLVWEVFERSLSEYDLAEFITMLHHDLYEMYKEGVKYSSEILQQTKNELHAERMENLRRYN